MNYNAGNNSFLSQDELAENIRVKPEEIYPFSWCWLDYMKQAASFLIIGVTVLVVAIPEGLPLAVTISLAFSVKKMMQDNNLVRHLDSCETMGNATAICSDKTGTLTTNRMTVQHCYMSGRLFKECTPNLMKLPVNTVRLFLQGISINTNYTSQVVPDELGGEDQQLGNKTECALLGFVNKCAQNLENQPNTYQEFRQKMPESEFKKVYTFNSARKSMTTIIPSPCNTKLIVYVKGAAEIILSKCATFLDGDGNPREIRPGDRKAVKNDVIGKMAEEALRTIGLAYKEIPLNSNLDNEAAILSKLTMVAITGIEDPVRPEVPRSIDQCQKAGITVRMVTGDNIVTARSIATKCGIIGPNDQDSLVIEGKYGHGSFEAHFWGPKYALTSKFLIF